MINVFKYLDKIRELYNTGIISKQAAFFYEKDVYLFKIAEAISKMEISSVVIKGSYIYESILTNNFREPNDIDFSINKKIDDEEKIVLAREIIQSIDERILVRGNTHSFGQFGFYPYISCIDDSLKDIKIECMIRSPIISNVVCTKISPRVSRDLKWKENEELFIKTYSLEQMFIDKLFSLNYFCSDVYNGDKGRYICTLYDLDKMFGSCFEKAFFESEVELMVLEKKRMDYPIHMEQFGKELDDIFFLKKQYNFPNENNLDWSSLDYIYNNSFNYMDFKMKYEIIRKRILEICAWNKVTI